MSFKQNDRVKVIASSYGHLGELGNVVNVGSDEETFLIHLDSGNTHGFFKAELELVDEKREALIELAETLDKARLQANAIDELVIQSQRGVYGTIALSLHDTLEEIIGAGYEATRYAHADRVYDSILDGNTVREALKAVGK